MALYLECSSPLAFHRNDLACLQRSTGTANRRANCSGAFPHDFDKWLRQHVSKPETT
jgi:hypothetical protein